MELENVAHEWVSGLQVCRGRIFDVMENGRMHRRPRTRTHTYTYAVRRGGERGREKHENFHFVKEESILLAALDVLMVDRIYTVIFSFPSTIRNCVSTRHHLLKSRAWSRIHRIPSARKVSGSLNAKVATSASKTAFWGASRLYWGHAGVSAGLVFSKLGSWS
jgi:hypothetical protein